MPSFPLWCLTLIRKLLFGAFGAVLCVGMKLALAVPILYSSSTAEALSHARPLILGLGANVLWYLGAYIVKRVITSRSGSKLAHH